MQGTSSKQSFSGQRLLIAAAMVGAIVLAIVAWRITSIIIFSPDIRNVPNPGFQVGVEINGEFQTNDLILIPTGTSFMPAFRISGIKNDDVDEVKYWLDGKELDPNKHIILPKDVTGPIKLKARGHSEVIDASFGAVCFISIIDSEIVEPTSGKTHNAKGSVDQSEVKSEGGD